LATVELVRGLAQQIADRLRDDIFAGRLTEEDRLIELNLADRFGVSRGPVRQALATLVHEGLLVWKPNIGAAVAPSAPDSIGDFVMPIRRTIETCALRLFFDEITEDDLRVWDEILSALQLACVRKDYATAIEQDLAFHRSIVERARQPHLTAIWRVVVGPLRSYFRRIAQTYEDPLQNYLNHKIVVDAIRSGDKEAAVKALENHIRPVTPELRERQV
jgi:DNA-binding GntR family transcriptional regulator